MANQVMKDKLWKLGLGIFGFLFVFGFIGAVYLSVTSTNKFPPRPDRIVDEWIAEKNLQEPVSITVMRGLNRGHVDVLYQKNWPGPTEEKLTYPLGNLVEPWIADAVLILSDRGELDLKAPISTYLQDLPADQGAMSLAAYLDHTAFVDDLVAEKPHFQRRELNYRLLKKTVEAVTGQSCDTFILESVVKPLELNDTYFEAATAEKPSCWFTTAEDLTKWAKMLNSNRLVKMKTQQRAMTPVTIGDGDKWLYGYGWRFQPWYGYRMMDATGMESDFGYAMIRVPQKNFSVLILSRAPREAFDPVAAGSDIARMYLQREFPDNYRYGEGGATLAQDKP